MKIQNSLVLDISTAPIVDAATYLEGTVKVPSNYKDPEKIAAYIRETEAERASMAATDVDLARITGIASRYGHDDVCVSLCKCEGEEVTALSSLAMVLRSGWPSIVTFGGFNFDLPLVQRRARYLGVDFPPISTDRFKSPHVDLCEVMSDRNPQRRRSLQFYAKRLGYADISKPLSGAEEAQVPLTGKWHELAASLRHDVTATYRLACWLGLIDAAPVVEPAGFAEVGL